MDDRPVDYEVLELCTSAALAFESFGAKKSGRMDIRFGNPIYFQFNIRWTVALLICIGVVVVQIVDFLIREELLRELVVKWLAPQLCPPCPIERVPLVLHIGW